MATAVTVLEEQEEMAATAKKERTKPEKGKTADESKSDMVRIQFDFSRDALSSLDQLVKDTNVKTRAEVIRRALEVYIDILEAKGKKAKVFIEELDGTRTRILGL